MTRSFFNIVWENEDLLVVDKLAGILTMGQTKDDPSVLSAVRCYLEDECESAEPFVAIIGRLDVPVAGLLIIAKNARSANSLWEQQRQGQIFKEYLALVQGEVEHDSMRLTDWIVKHRRHRRVAISAEAIDGAQEAKMRYRVVARWLGETGLAIELLTGRKHQIRAQLSHHGLPIRGDRKYGGQPWQNPGIGLCCHRVSFLLPGDGATRLAFHRSTPWRDWRVK